HPELVAVAPTFRKGLVFEEGRDDWGVSMEGAGYTATGTTTIPVMPGLTEQQANAMHGASIFPNMLIDLTGTVVIATRMQPRGPEHTTITTDYLFRPETIADPGFDPTETVEFSELVAHQDYVVCERVELGAEFVLPGYEVLRETAAQLGLELFEKGTLYGDREPRGGPPVTRDELVAAYAALRDAGTGSIANALERFVPSPGARAVVAA